jgi:hypothetical protein
MTDAERQKRRRDKWRERRLKAAPWGSEEAFRLERLEWVAAQVWKYPDLNSEAVSRALGDVGLVVRMHCYEVGYDGGLGDIADIGGWVDDYLRRDGLSRREPLDPSHGPFRSPVRADGTPSDPRHPWNRYNSKG